MIGCIFMLFPAHDAVLAAGGIPNYRDHAKNFACHAVGF
jgi:hypothetical protein